VVAVARPWAGDVLRALGAEVFVDVDPAPLSKVDLVFDLVGGETLRRACAAVRPGAMVVSVVEPPPVDANRRGRFFVVEPSRPQLHELGERIAAGEIRPVVGATWPLSEGRAAFEAKHRGGQPGKAVLLVADES
jgi:NADPH:quinone reductase-like Zn-dependent oxidoreductase